MKLVYLAGPMSNIPAFNFPLFHAVAAALRVDGWNIVSPAETDPPDVQAIAIASPDGKYDSAGKVGSETWGDMLARDVKLLSDGGVTGICFLPGFERSRGARLEAFVGLLNGLSFYEWDPASEMPLPRSAEWVQDALMNPWLDARRKVKRA